MAKQRVASPWGTTFCDSISFSGPGRWIYVSGQIGADGDGNMVNDTIAAEADQCFDRIRQSLEKAGAEMSDVVKITGYVTSKDCTRTTISRAAGPSRATPPSSATVQVAGLVNDADRGRGRGVHPCAGLRAAPGSHGSAAMTLLWSAHISWLFGELPSSSGWGRLAEPAFAGRNRLAAAGRARGPAGAWWPSNAVGVALLNCCAGRRRSRRARLRQRPCPPRGGRAGLPAGGRARRADRRARLNLLVGRIAPRRQRRPPARAVLDTCARSRPRPPRAGCASLIEPVNAIENPGYLAPTPRDAIELIDACAPQARSACCWTSTTSPAPARIPVAAIERCNGGCIGHVQLSDFPGRGHARQRRARLRHASSQQLDAGPYDGAVGLEFEPHPERDPPLEGLLRDARLPVRP